MNQVKAGICNDLKKMNYSYKFIVQITATQKYNVASKKLRSLVGSGITNMELFNSSGERWFTPKWILQNLSETRKEIILEKRYKRT